jgi:DNA end-binding protein Ku
MARKIWTGSINFGLVTIPVGLYSATEDHTIQFHQYQRGTTDRVRYRRINERTGDEVEYGDVVKGREVNGELITVEPAELEEIAPGRSRTIDITEFVDLDEIDPIFFQKTYWLAPNSKEHDKPYNLLRQAMDRTNQVGIARFVLRGKEYLTAVRADENVLALNTLFFADEIRSPSEVVGEETTSAEASDKELQMAENVIDSMSGEWQPEEFEDTYTARVEQLLNDKSEGRTPTKEQAPPNPTDVIDLTDVLQRSVQESRRGRGSGSGRKRRGAPAQRSEDVSGLSKTELDKKAKELGVRGRSKMKRPDLENAVAEALSSGQQSPKKAS